ncbi:deoxynucleoside kinase [Bacillus sp. HMF5848]|uniref:deoxynucleoside kinase n=1 Tax=Bacillus sp. HMF5848 TaxID=2495421 RepID=UPI000F7ACE1D|nr:deoxynucleoside kinase [Bacillus sp. HMF5848]RSK25451.1 deoxynucleoside kinase [Bacillus sp. HMF5848]
MKFVHNIPKNAIITLAGTVGVGKSTLTTRLSEAIDFKPAYESVQNNPYLEDYYKDFKRWAFHLQVYFLAERFKQQKEMVASGGGYVQDRSIFEDYQIFGKLQYESGNMSDRDFLAYSSMFEAMTMDPYFPKPDLLIYVNGSFDSIINRMQQRGRPMELETPVSYWENLYQRYQTWINNFQLCPVLQLDIDSYDCEDHESLQEIVTSISTMLQKHTRIQRAR